MAPDQILQDILKVFNEAPRVDSYALQIGTSVVVIPNTVIVSLSERLSSYMEQEDS